MNTSVLRNPFFQALHSPKGANAYFACGLEGSGAIAVETDRVPVQNLYVGTSDGTKIQCFPFFSQRSTDWAKDFMIEGVPEDTDVCCYDRASIERFYEAASDRFVAPNLTFEIASPTDGIADPATAPYSQLRLDLCPALALRLTVDNTEGDRPIEAFFAIDGANGAADLTEMTGHELCGFTSKNGYAVAARSADGARTIQNNTARQIFLDRQPNFKLSAIAGVALSVPAGQKKTFDLVIGFFSSNKTRGTVSADYLYKRYFTDLLSVLYFAFEHVEEIWKKVEQLNQDPRLLALNPFKQFMVNHAKHSYFASTMVFDEGGRCRYVVNEGTFMMMNTFDLTVDHLVYELVAMPWAVKNQLDSFADEYSYYDKLHFPGGENVYEGGISFTHDQGVYGYFTPAGYSSYEMPNIEGCYSYMTAEQLCNYIVCAGAYVAKTNDLAWLRKRRALLEDCLTSLLHRDHPDEDKRNGVMALDSSRCDRESEITTYDSLDPSLGQSRNNNYIASKFFASYLILEMLFEKCGKQDLAATAARQASLCAQTIADSFDPESGILPAIIGEDNNTPIIPAAEGLIYLYLCGLENKMNEYHTLMEIYRRHLQTVLRKGCCLFDDNGWRLSAGNTNTWMSKIFLNQFVAQRLLHVDISHCDVQSDETHANWWADYCREEPCIDQVYAGRNDSPGFHYPRSVTSQIWLY